MTLTASGYQVGRLLLVVVGSAVAYIVLGVLIYSMYFSLTSQVYDRRLDEGLITLQVVFYTFFALHLLASASVVWVLTRWTGAPVYPVLALVVAIFAIAAFPTLAILSFSNYCETNVSFPIPGMTNC